MAVVAIPMLEIYSLSLLVAIINYGVPRYRDRTVSKEVHTNSSQVQLTYDGEISDHKRIMIS